MLGREVADIIRGLVKHRDGTLHNYGDGSVRYVERLIEISAYRGSWKTLEGREARWISGRYCRLRVIKYSG